MRGRMACGGLKRSLVQGSLLRESILALVNSGAASLEGLAAWFQLRQQPSQRQPRTVQPRLHGPLGHSCAAGDFVVVQALLFTHLERGPLLGGELLQGVRLTLGNIQELIKEGEARNAGSDLVRFTDGLLPGWSLWYARLAWERFLSDEIQAWIDGGDAEARFRRVERAAEKDFDQRYWWRPGQTQPDRAPDAAAAGGS